MPYPDVAYPLPAALGDAAPSTVAVAVAVGVGVDPTCISPGRKLTL